jgi:hypothetical protein
MDPDDFNVPEKILVELESEKPKIRRGYPERLDKGRLWGVRQHLLVLLETTWDDVGCVLPRVKTMAQLKMALEPWRKRVDQEEHVIKALLRPSAVAATSKLLNRQRKEQGKLHNRFLDAFEWVGKCWDSLERFMVIPVADLTSAEQDVILDAINERARVLARAGAEFIVLRDQEKASEELLKDGEAYFARAEFLRFCKSKRYRLIPLNLANALAGLPLVGCRHSIRRCRRFDGEVTGGLSYQIFNIIRRIVQVNVRRSDLIRDAERWLRNRRSPKSLGISDLRRNWYYFRRAIRAVLDQETSRTLLPSAISREYWRHKSNPTALDRAFAADEGIED